MSNKNSIHMEAGVLCPAGAGKSEKDQIYLFNRSRSEFGIGVQIQQCKVHC